MNPSTPCPYFNASACQVCTHLELPYDEQLTQKKAQLLGDTHQLDIYPSRPLGFRDKAKLQVSGTIDHPLIGFLDPQSLRVLHPIEACPLHNANLNQIIASLPRFIQAAKINPYDARKRTGELKGFILFHSPTTNQGYVRVVVRSKESLDRIVKIAPRFFPKLIVSVNIQPIAHAVLEGKEEYYLEQTYITHKFNQKKFFLSPQGFVQTNTHVAQMLYQCAIDWVKDLGLKRLVDAFSGAGPFAFHLEDYVEQSFGIEVNPHAVETAQLSANHFGHKTQFSAARASELGEKIAAFNPDLVVVNPPRAGLREFIQTLIDVRPSTILYSSCNRDTLAQDLRTLQHHYKATRFALFDMFPQSAHYEVLTLLSHK
jgi:23S rRNA (uracil747-C5)-methyltransferase